MNLQRILLIFVILTSPLLCLFGSVYLNEANAQAIYKHIDETGRVSYSNQPRKGAVAVDLAPLTMMQGVPVAKVEKPKQSVTTEQVTPIAPAVQANSQTITPTQSNAPIGFPTPRVLPVPDSAPHQALAPVMPVRMPSVAVAGGIDAATMAKQRRNNVKRRIVEGEIEAEEQLFSETREALSAEQARSPAMRMLRTSLPNEARPSETTTESRALIERHFARVRDLQDHTTMHEQNLRELREMLVSVANSDSVRPQTLSAVPAKPAKILGILPKTASKTMPKAQAAIPQAAIDPANVATVSNTPTPGREVKNTTALVASTAQTPAIASAVTNPANPANPEAIISSSTPIQDEVDARAISQLPVIKLRPASNNHTNNVVASLPKRSMAEDR